MRTRAQASLRFFWNRFSSVIPRTNSKKYMIIPRKVQKLAMKCLDENKRLNLGINDLREAVTSYILGRLHNWLEEVKKHMDMAR